MDDIMQMHSMLRSGWGEFFRKLMSCRIIIRTGESTEWLTISSSRGS
jgi:hypothetical protein